MTWPIYADLTRTLAVHERRALADAVEAAVPNGGCVGLNASGVDEIYFEVEALDTHAARAVGQHYVALALRHAELPMETVEISVGARRD